MATCCGRGGEKPSLPFGFFVPNCELTPHACVCLCADTFAAYSTVPNDKRQAIQAAAYELRDGIIAMRDSLAEVESVEECASEEEEEEECVHPEPVEALEQVLLQQFCAARYQYILNSQNFWVSLWGSTCEHCDGMATLLQAFQHSIRLLIAKPC